MKVILSLIGAILTFLMIHVYGYLFNAGYVYKSLFIFVLYVILMLIIAYKFFHYHSSKEK